MDFLHNLLALLNFHLKSMPFLKILMPSEITILAGLFQFHLYWYWPHNFCRNIDQVRRNSMIILCRSGCMDVFPVVVLNKTWLEFLPTLHNYSSVHGLVLLGIIQVQNEMVRSLLSWRRKSVPMPMSCPVNSPSGAFLSTRFHLQFWRLHAMLLLLSNA